MKPQLFKNPINGEQWICDDVRLKKVIEGQVYINVHKPGQTRTVLMRKDSLSAVNKV